MRGETFKQMSASIHIQNAYLQSKTKSAHLWYLCLLNILSYTSGLEHLQSCSDDRTSHSPGIPKSLPEANFGGTAWHGPKWTPHPLENNGSLLIHYLWKTSVDSMINTVWGTMFPRFSPTKGRELDDYAWTKPSNPNVKGCLGNDVSKVIPPLRLLQGKNPQNLRTVCGLLWVKQNCCCCFHSLMNKNSAVAARRLVTADFITDHPFKPPLQIFRKNLISWFDKILGNNEIRVV